MYKNLSKAKEIKTPSTLWAACEQREQVQVYTTRKRFKFSNTCDDPSEGEAVKMDLGGLGNVKGVKLCEWNEGKLSQVPKNG